MSKVLFIHIGTHKTGSTAIQNFLHINRNELLNHRILYPGTTENHFLLAKELGELNNPISTTENQTFKIFIEIKEQYNKYDKFIISSEAFYRYDKLLLSKLKKTLLFFELDIQIKIIVFLRPQYSWLQSGYQQTVKDINNRSSLTFKQFRTSKYYVDYCDYYLHIEYWASYFKKENILVIPYDNKQSKTQIYRSFLKAIDVPNSINFKTPPSCKTNKGLNIINIEFLRWLNIFGISILIFKRIFEVLESKESTQSTSYNYLNPTEKDQITQTFASSNNKVALEYLNMTSGILFPNIKTIKSETDNVFIQKDYFDPELFKNQIKQIKNQNDDLLESFYTETLNLNLNDLVAINSKNFLLSLLESFLGKTTINYLKTKDPSSDSKNLFFLKETKDWSTSLNINHTNFTKKTLNFSKHCSNKSRIVNQTIIIDSVGNDPYFSIQKCKGNYDSETFIKIVLESPSETITQIFFQKRTISNYSESATLKRKIQKGLNTICFIIDDPDFNGQIRIDPGNEAGIYTIHEIVVKSNTRSYKSLFFENMKLIYKLKYKVNQILVVCFYSKYKQIK